MHAAKFGILSIILNISEAYREVRIWFTSHLNVQLPSADVIARGQNWGTGISLTGLRICSDRRGVYSFLVIGNPPSSFLVFDRQFRSGNLPAYFPSTFRRGMVGLVG